MKQILFYLFLFFISINVYSQDILQDVIYLKNGGIIRGLIIEQVPNKTYKIQTADRNVFVYSVNEVEKLTKELNPDYKKLKEESSKSRFDRKPERKSYIALKFGASIPFGDYASSGDTKTGGFGGIESRILLSQKVGITLSAIGGSNPIDSRYGNDVWSYGCFMGGFNFNLLRTERMNWEYRIIAGVSVVNAPSINFGTFGSSSSSVASSAFSITLIGTSFEVYLNDNISLLFNADTFASVPTFNYRARVSGVVVSYEVEQEIGIWFLGVGLGFRLDKSKSIDRKNPQSKQRQKRKNRSNWLLEQIIN